MHIFGLHAADLIHEASNAVATGQRVQDIKFNVHAHPTLSEVRHTRRCVPREAAVVAVSVSMLRVASDILPTALR